MSIFNAPIDWRHVRIRTWLTLCFSVTLVVVALTQAVSTMTVPHLLTDPFLQLPTDSSVRVAWFTEFAGTRHLVAYG